MSKLSILDKAREITSKYQPDSRQWKFAMSELASEYFEKAGKNVDTYIQMETIANQVIMEQQQVNRYLESKVKL